MSDAPTVAVIGGGATGLTAAYRLGQRGYDIHLYEAGAELGGLVRTFEVGGEPIECFYHHLFTSDSAAKRLFEELGVSDRIEWHESRVGTFRDGRIFPFTTALDLLRFSPIGIRDRVKLGLTSMQLGRMSDGSQFEETTAAEWLRREVGTQATGVIWEPLLRGKFGAMWDKVVMTWLWNKLKTRFSSRTRLWQREMLGYMRGSFGAWTERIVARLRELDCGIETGARVDRIVSEGGLVGIELGGRTTHFDAVIATVSNSVFERIAPDLTDGYAAKLRGTPYQDVVCLTLVLDRPLTDYYWLNIADAEVPFVAVIEHTNLVDAERYGGRHIVYVPSYVDRDSSALETLDETLASYLPHLQRINAAFDQSWIVKKHLFRARDAQPVFTAGAGDRIPHHRTPVPGLYLANMAQIYPQDRGQNYAIERGEAVADMVAEDLARGSVRSYRV